MAAAAGIVIGGCGDTSKREARTQVDSVGSVPVAVSSTAARARQPRATLVMPDSLASEPRIVSENHSYVLHLPADMARLLADSVPEFVPIQEVAYPPAVFPQVDTPASVITVDFNGDSNRDAVMVGNTMGTPIFFVLLQRSATVPEPRIVFISRPYPNTPSDLGIYRLQYVAPGPYPNPDNPRDTLHLRTGAVMARTEYLSTIWYWYRGKVRTFSLEGD